jgi:hypothetical protein
MFVYPNRVTNQLKFNYNTETEHQAQLNVTTGRVVIAQMPDVSFNENIFDIDILKPGVYTIRVGTESQRLIVE